MANPLTEEHLTAINDALDGLDVSDEILSKAKLAGINMEEQEKRQAELRGKLTRIMQVFFRQS